MIKPSKSAMRNEAKRARAAVSGRAEKAVELIRRFPAQTFSGAHFAGFWPLYDEIDLRPLMHALHDQGELLCLPVTGASGSALKFYDWTPHTDMQAGRFGTLEPRAQNRPVTPSFMFVPLLAFTLDGARLGYGGGYYDRTLHHIRMNTEVFACGVGFDAQKTSLITMESHDVKLDAVLTPSGFVLT